MCDARDCNRCVYSTRDGGCRRFTCHGTETVDDVREKAVGEFVDWIIENKSCCGYIDEISDKVLKDWVLAWKEANK